ncbi:hypothetical protein [Microbacterium terricola]|uniref:Alternate signal-mediated exported protein, RER_14450 family n=1 Tax=Microbacterium terricola TaxID=344163 RepID=A0ABM8E2P7_9MICO|nr:hypothetical protein [Microbacterium terricola]UYK40228.1 hypothetical protein OAU46_00835 [Microbacterium terricola]BDV32065.1 hypothetical protein Microterr_27250 [Microbacterium terricola]
MSSRDRTDRKDRRNTIIRISIAGLAVFGIGAAITTAAWTDQVWFAAEADVASLDLKGSTTATGPWDDYATEGDALTIPVSASDFGALQPNRTYEMEVYVKNADTADATLTVDADLTGAIADAGSTITVDAVAAETALATDDVTAVTITLTTGDIPATLQGATGTALVTVTGTSS